MVEGVGANHQAIRLQSTLANLGITAIEQRQALSTELAPILIDDFSPILFRFPYRYPKKFSRLWVHRFSSRRPSEWHK